MPDYAAMKTELPKLKAALTRAKNSGDPERVIAACETALHRFDEIGWPDCWAMFDVAHRDAMFALHRSF